MSRKGGPVMVANGYIFSCNNTNWGFKSQHYTFKDCSCPVRLNTERWDLVKTIKSEHTCIMPNTTIARLLKWYLVQVMPTSKDLSAIQLSVLSWVQYVNSNDAISKSHLKRRHLKNAISKTASRIYD
ncbi:hypothetical protein DSO57_1012687 [Entomophthora muscae]|uniref:Uncharacterized protein n=1 Tax=Entomophthora muscae TaxID=34485 RepID=A0ACC2TTF6_9FUNG|nr:hypothetical protein DSO57_1012687 [Entomophthora muscae]